MVYMACSTNDVHGNILTKSSDVCSYSLDLVVGVACCFSSILLNELLKACLPGPHSREALLCEFLVHFP